MGKGSAIATTYRLLLNALNIFSISRESRISCYSWVLKSNKCEFVKIAKVENEKVRLRVVVVVVVVVVVISEVHRLERRSNKIVATENGLFNTISAGHSRYYHESLKLLNLRLAAYF